MFKARSNPFFDPLWRVDVRGLLSLGGHFVGLKETTGLQEHLSLTNLGVYFLPFFKWWVLKIDLTCERIIILLMPTLAIKYKAKHVLGQKIFCVSCSYFSPLFWLFFDFVNGVRGRQCCLLIYLQFLRPLGQLERLPSLLSIPGWLSGCGAFL